MWTSATATRTGPRRGATRSATPADPNCQVRGWPGASRGGPLGRRGGGCRGRGSRIGRRGRAGRPAMRGQVGAGDIRDPERGDGHHQGGAGTQDERGGVAGLVVQEPGRHGTDREREAGQQSDPGIPGLPVAQRVDGDRVRQRLPRRLEDPERHEQAGDDHGRPCAEQQEQRDDPADRAHLQRSGTPEPDIREVAPGRDRDRERHGAQSGERPIPPGSKPNEARMTEMNGRKTPSADADGQHEDPQGDHRGVSDDATVGRSPRFCGTCGHGGTEAHWPITVGQRRV